MVNDFLFCGNNPGRNNETVRYSTEFVIPGSSDFPQILEELKRVIQSCLLVLKTS